MTDREDSFMPSDEWGSFQFTTSADAKRAANIFNRLSSERDILMEALGFYANGQEDRGSIARAALSKVRP